MAARLAPALLLAAGITLAVSDSVHRSSSNHRLRHGRGDLSFRRDYRSLEVTAEVTAAVGDEVTLDCGDSAAPIAPWFHDGQRTPTSKRLRPRAFGRLNVQQLRVSDAGVWHCRDPSEPPGPRSTARAVVLKVYAAPEEPYILFRDEQVSDVAPPLDVVENNLVTLTCVSRRSLPPAVITWFLGDRNDVNVTDQSRTVTRPSDFDELYSSRSHLTLNVTRAMAGERVTCVTSHRELHVRQQKSLALNVQYPPRFTVIRTPAFGNPILRGMRVNLTCLIDSNPAVQPRWAKDESVPRVANRNGTIVFNPIGPSDAGWYRCVASHLGSNVSSYSFFLNVIDETSSSGGGGEGGGASFRTVQTTVGAPVSLKCTDGGHDRSKGIPCWVRENARSGQSAVTSRGYRMHLDGALYEDTGVYTCQMPPISDVETSRRETARSFFVKVTGKPMVSNISHSSDLVLGQPASLRASFCADPAPTHVLWVVGSFAARPGYSSDLAQASDIADGDLNSCFAVALHLQSLRPEMVGDVTLVVTNQLGTDQMTRQFTVARPSHVTFGGAESVSGGALTRTIIALTFMAMLSNCVFTSTIF